MSDWASNEKDKMLFENWRSYVTEQEEQNSSVKLIQDGDSRILKNLLSTENSDSLYNVILKSSKTMTDFATKTNPNGFIEFIRSLAIPISKMADEKDIVLENISLSGDRAEGIRVMDLSSEAGKELITALKDAGVTTAVKTAVVKALNRWGRLNSVKFVMPQQQQQQQADVKNKAGAVYDSLEGYSKKQIDKILAQYSILPDDQKKRFKLIFKGLMAKENEAE